MTGKPPRRKSTTRRSGFARLRFLLELLVLRGLQVRVLLAVAVVMVVAMVAGILVTVLDGSFSGPAEGVWWAFLRLTDPGYLGDDEGVARRIVSTLVTVLGYVLFLGLLIAIITQWLNQTIDRLESGVTPVVLSDHVIILGWTNQTRAIAEALLRTGSRTKRFLSGRGARDLRIVVMAERVDEALRQRLRERLGPTTLGKRVLLRSGTPLRVDHLERVAFRDAAVVILPGSGFAEQNPGLIDSRTIKTLASVSRFANESGTAPPFAVAELFDARRVAVANQVYDGPSEVIAADAIVSRLIAQSARHCGLWDVLSELFVLHEGNAIYVRQIEGQAGTEFRDLRERFSRAILLGIIRPTERRPLLNPDPGTVFEAEDLAVFLAREYEDCVPDPEGASVWGDLATEQGLRVPTDGTRRVLILGWSRKVPALLRELGRFGDDAFEIDVVSRTSIEAREAGLAVYGGSNLGKVRQIEARFSEPDVLQGLGPEQYDNVIVLASEMLAEKEQADAISEPALVPRGRRGRRGESCGRQLRGIAGGATAGARVGVLGADEAVGRADRAAAGGGPSRRQWLRAVRGRPAGRGRSR